MADIFTGDVGTVFRLTVTDQDGAVVDLTGADLLQMIFQKPDGTDLTVTAVVYGSPSNGVMQYTSIAGTLDQAGRWQVQGYIELSGNKWRTSISTFRVKAAL